MSDLSNSSSSPSSSPTIEYVNSVILGLVKNFWKERGGGARFKVTTVGWDYFLSHNFENPTTNVEEAFARVKDLLRRDGIVEDMSYRLKENALLEGDQTYDQVEVLELRVEGCMHLPIERALLETGLPPYMCPILNVVACALEKDQRVSSEIASITIDGNVCKLQMVLFGEKAF